MGSHDAKRVGEVVTSHSPISPAQTDRRDDILEKEYSADSTFHNTNKRSSNDAVEDHELSLEKHESVEAPQPQDEKHDNASIATVEEDREQAVQPDSHDVEKADTVSSRGPLHSVFSPGRRRFIIVMAATAGFFSPLSANIYFPALNALSADLHTSSSLMNLTLTTYMIFQGLAPTLFGDLADTAGRRPAYIIGFTLYIGACIGCALQDSFAALLVLRCLQSSGSSSTIALASGVASDVATAAERGTYMGWVNGGALLGPAIGPVLGGILSQFLGWRSIFWFLVILAGLFMIPLVLVFPETARNVVGSGSVPPQRWNRDLLSVIRDRRRHGQKGLALERTESRASAKSKTRAALAAKRQLRFPNPLKTLKICFERDVGLLLLFNCLVYTAFYCVITTIPYLFGQIYGFNDLQIGLCFLPFGVGCFLAPLINGRIMDWRFRVVAKKIGVEIRKGRTTEMRGFPLEEARIPLALILVLVGNSTLLCYGWVVDVNGPLAASLVLLFVMGFALTGSFNCCSVMLVDYYPQSPAMATAGNNLCRCLLGAGGTAAVIPMIDAMGRGWCFTFVALVIYCTTPILLVLTRWGPKWREQRMQRLEEKRGAAG